MAKSQNNKKTSKKKPQKTMKEKKQVKRAVRNTPKCCSTSKTPPAWPGC